MFSALKKLTKSGDDRCRAPTPMSSSLQKKFSRGVHFNMKILIKGDRNVGKSCLLQRLQGGPFIEEYVPTDQIQVAPIHWTYKNTDYIVKVEVWEVVDKGRTKKKPNLGLKLENQSTQAETDDGQDTPVLDATFLDVYKNTSGVILMLDITKPWTFEYVVKELARMPADLPVVVLGNHCDMQHHRQVHAHHIDQCLHHAKLSRSAPVRYAESSMRNGFGLRLLHKFFSVPFLRLQRTSLLEQLQRNQKDTEEMENDLNEYQCSEESNYNLFVERLVNKRRASAGQTEAPRPVGERSPSIVLGAGKPIIPPSVNPLFAQSLNPTSSKPQQSVNAETSQVKQSQYVSPELLKPKQPAGLETTAPAKLVHQDRSSGQSTSSGVNVSATSGALDEFYAGTLDSSFLDDLTPSSNTQDINYESDSDDGITSNPMVTVDEDDLEAEASPTLDVAMGINPEPESRASKQEDTLRERFMSHSISKDSINTEISDMSRDSIFGRRVQDIEMSLDNEFPLWAGDSSARRSPEGGEDPDIPKESSEKAEKKPKKKKSKDKDRGDYSDKSDRKERKHKHKKSKGEKPTPNPQQDLLAPITSPYNYDVDEYDSI